MIDKTSFKQLFLEKRASFSVFHRALRGLLWPALVSNGPHDTVVHIPAWSE